MCVNYVIFIRNKSEIFRIAFVRHKTSSARSTKVLKFLPFYALRSIFTVRIYFTCGFMNQKLCFKSICEKMGEGKSK